jgi:hypothetical protein
VLNAQQKSAVEVTLRVLEETVRDLKRRVREPPENALLTRIVPIPVGDRSRLEGVLDGILEEVDIVVREFDLQARDEEIRGRIAGYMSQSWSAMHEVLSGRLNRFGEVDPRVGRKLDPHLRRLIRLTLEAVRVAERKQESQ